MTTPHWRYIGVAASKSRLAGEEKKKVKGCHSGRYTKRDLKKKKLASITKTAGAPDPMALPTGVEASRSKRKKNQKGRHRPKGGRKRWAKSHKKGLSGSTLVPPNLMARQRMG